MFNRKQSSPKADVTKTQANPSKPTNSFWSSCLLCSPSAPSLFEKERAQTKGAPTVQSMLYNGHR